MLPVPLIEMTFMRNEVIHWKQQFKQTQETMIFWLLWKQYSAATLACNSVATDILFLIAKMSVCA